MTLNRSLTMSLLLAGLSATTAAAQSPAQVRQENQHEWNNVQKQQQEQQRQQDQQRQREYDRSFPPAACVPPDPTINALWELDSAHKQGKKFLEVPSRAPYWDAVAREPYSSKLASFETVSGWADPSLRNVLLMMPSLRRLEIRGTIKNWEETEGWLDRLATTDPDTAAKLAARFKEIPEVVLDLNGYETLTQQRLDELIALLAKSRRINGLKLMIFNQGLGYSAEARRTWPTDLRGLARLGHLRELQLNVDSLAQLSLGFPGRLEKLSVQERFASSAPLAHVRLPHRLRSLSVESTSQVSLDRFGSLAKEIPGLEPRVTLTPHDYFWQSEMADGQLRGEWRRSGNPSGGVQIDLVSSRLLWQAADKAGVPGYKDTVCRVMSVSPYKEGSPRVLTMEISHYGPPDGGVGPGMSGVARFEARIESGRMTLTPSPVKELYYSAYTVEGAKAESVPNDAAFEAAAFRALKGEWVSAQEAYMPHPTELGSEGEQSLGEALAGDEPSSGNPFPLWWGAVAVLIGLIAWRAARAIRRPA